MKMNWPSNATDRVTDEIVRPESMDPKVEPVKDTPVSTTVLPPPDVRKPITEIQPEPIKSNNEELLKNPLVLAGGAILLYKLFIE